MVDSLRAQPLPSSWLTANAPAGPADIAASLRDRRLSPEAALGQLAPGARSPSDALARVLAGGDEAAIAAALAALQQLPEEARTAALAGLSADLLAALARAIGALGALGALGTRGARAAAPARPAPSPGAPRGAPTIAAPTPGRGALASTAPAATPTAPAATPASTPTAPSTPAVDASAPASPSSPASSSRYRPLLDLIGRHESESSGGYDAMNQGGTNGGHGIVGYSGPASPFLGKPLTQMTVQEVMDRQNPALYPQGGSEDRGIHAAGRYQIIGSTLKELVRRGVVSPSDRFDEATQDKLGAALIEGRRGQGLSGLRSEWIGLTHASDAELTAALRAAGL